MAHRRWCAISMTVCLPFTSSLYSLINYFHWEGIWNACRVHNSYDCIHIHIGIMLVWDIHAINYHQTVAVWHVVNEREKDSYLFNPLNSLIKIILTYFWYFCLRNISPVNVVIIRMKFVDFKWNYNYLHLP